MAASSRLGAGADAGVRETREARPGRSKAAPVPVPVPVAVVDAALPAASEGVAAPLPWEERPSQRSRAREEPAEEVPLRKLRGRRWSTHMRGGIDGQHWRAQSPRSRPSKRPGAHVSYPDMPMCHSDPPILALR